MTKNTWKVARLDGSHESIIEAEGMFIEGGSMSPVLVFRNHSNPSFGEYAVAVFPASDFYATLAGAHAEEKEDGK